MCYAYTLNHKLLYILRVFIFYVTKDLTIGLLGVARTKHIEKLRAILNLLMSLKVADRKSVV